MAERFLPIEMTAVAVIYVVLIRRRDIRLSISIEFGRASCFLAGICFLAVALVGPVDVNAAGALSWHMVQHLLIISVAAPLLAVGRPVELFFELLPRRFAARTYAWHGALVTMAAALAALATLLVWHVPALYQAALSSEAVHIVEHVTLLVTSMWLWGALIGDGDSGTSVVWLFLFTLPTTALGVAMTIARTPWYADYVTTTSADAVRDQQMAGVIMWAFGGLAALAGGVALFASWLTGASATAPAGDHHPNPSAGA
ncbi:MAG: cytochrome c oxidase assembly protein, partial [Ilumatobacteraceae bacterium]